METKLDVERIDRRQLNKKRQLMIIIENKSLILLILICIVAEVVSGGIFFRGDNISSVLRQTSVTSILALGYVFVLTCGMIDLSTGFLLSLCGIIYATTALVLPVPVAILISVATGLGAGLLNGILSIKLNLIPFILTLGTAQVFRGIAYLACNGISFNITDNTIKYIGQGILFDVMPITFFIVIVLAVIVAIIMYRMSYGRHVFATGGNIEAARVSGINVARTKIIAFVVMGFMCSIAGVILTGRVAIAMPNAGQGMEMDAITAAIIGGTALSGGKANVMGAIFGALILGVISNLLNLAGLSSFWQWIFKGIIIIAAIMLDSLTDQIVKRTQITE